MTTKYSITYLGTIPATDEHVRTIIRSALKGTGYSLRQCGRNPNRKQFYHLHDDKARPVFQSINGEIRYDLPRVMSQRNGLQQDLPLEHATSVALYLKDNRRSTPDFDLPFDVRANRARRKVAEALAGQPVSVTAGTVAYLNEVKNLGKLHEVVTAIGKACKVLAMGPC